MFKNPLLFAQCCLNNLCYLVFYVPEYHTNSIRNLSCEESDIPEAVHPKKGKFFFML